MWKVFVAESSNKGGGAFAACAIREGEVVERGIVRDCRPFDGNSAPRFYLSEDRTVWAIGSKFSTGAVKILTRKC